MVTVAGAAASPFAGLDESTRQPGGGCHTAGQQRGARGGSHPFASCELPSHDPQNRFVPRPAAEISMSTAISGTVRNWISAGTA